MLVLQVAWLALIWLTGTAANWVKIPLLLLYSVVVGLGVIYAPGGLTLRLKLLEERLACSEKRALIVLCVVVLVVGVVYARSQRAWTDEGSGTKVASIVAERGIAQLFAEYTRYSWLGSQHPPLMVVIYGLAMRVFGPGLFARRLVCLAFAIATLLVTYFLGRESEDRRTGFRSALLLLSCPIFLRLGTTAMSDVPVTFFFALAMLLILRLLRRPTYRLAALAGGVILIGVLIKYTMVLIYPLLLVCLVAVPAFRRLRLHLAPLFLVPACLGAIWLVYAYRLGVLAEQVETLSSYATVVIRTDIGKQFLLESLTTRLPSAIGVYNAPLLFLGGLYAIRHRGQAGRIVVLWIAVVFTLLIVMLPDHRYFLLAFPALAILMARGLESAPGIAERAVMLALCYCAGALYLFVDWQRVSLLFLP
jgi:4-amino-4-deoxy-L-arabinose transferase-like glycosyltransferase